MIAVTTLTITCTRCGRALSPWRYPKLITGGSCPDRLAQPCKDCRAAKVAASLAADTLKICQRHRFGSAVMLLTDLLDVLDDPDEVSQAGRNPLASPEGPAGSGHGG